MNYSKLRYKSNKSHEIKMHILNIQHETQSVLSRYTFVNILCVCLLYALIRVLVRKYFQTQFDGKQNSLT